MDTASEDESTSSEQDESESQPKLSEEDRSEYQPSSSREDESDCKPRRPQKTNKHVETHRGPVALDQHHFRADTDLEVGTAISTGETLELQNGSFLKITNSGHLLRRIKAFHDYLPATASGTELVWVCEAKEHDDKTEGCLKSVISKDVLRTRHLVLHIPEFASRSLPQFKATRVFMDSRPLICQWMFVAELSKPRTAGGKRSSKSAMEGSQGQATALSSHDPFVGGCLPAEIPW